MALVWLKKDKLIFTYITSFLLAYYATVNAQIIIGFNIHPDHWYRAAFLPWGLAFFALGVWLYGKLPAPNSKPLTISAYVLISALGLWGLASNYLLARTVSDKSGLPAGISESYSWLNQNTLSRSTVGSVSFATDNRSGRRNLDKNRLDCKNLRDGRQKIQKFAGKFQHVFIPYALSRRFPRIFIRP